jgi:O-antigen/teichoic acid export membrane protein
MNPLKRLAGQTAIYGIPSILGRMLGFLLVPLYTRVFLPGDYGTVNVFYAYASFLMVVLTYGMETAFFKFNEGEEDKTLKGTGDEVKSRVFSAGAISLLVSSLVFLLFISVFARPVARWIEYPDHSEYVIWFAWMLSLDALSAIPFARLRAQNKAKRFAVIKFIGIFINIGLNLFFLLLCPYLDHHLKEGFMRDVLHLVYRNDWRIEYIFISNLAASAATLLLLFPEYSGLRWQVDKKVWRRMIIYAFPLLFAGMAGMVNETFDRLLLRYLLPHDLSSYQVGIYSACYKISILMTIFIQAYKYAAEPFFFAQSKEKDAKVTYAKIMDYFIITVSLIFLATMLYLDDFILRLLVGRKYWEGRGVIPVLMMANLFLGVYYNLSIWYKLTSKTMWGAWLSVIGAVITLALNFWWIPLSPDHLIYGYYGSAWATFICYGSMMIISYLIGQKYFPVKYNLLKFFGYLGLAVLIYVISKLFTMTPLSEDHLHTLLLLIFVFVAWRIERRTLSKVL